MGYRALEGAVCGRGQRISPTWRNEHWSAPAFGQILTNRQVTWMCAHIGGRLGVPPVGRREAIILHDLSGQPLRRRRLDHTRAAR
ncbi:hypothetical protein TQ38_027915 (plasmid) [Novosphingobium sp. P6W]|nr:hypothetical protein TQ38_027915 [Novosphingobium sp. P6W]